MLELVVKELESLRSYQFLCSEQCEETVLVAAEQAELKAVLSAARSALKPSPFALPGTESSLAQTLISKMDCLCPYDLRSQLTGSPALALQCSGDLPWEFVFAEHLVARQPHAREGRARVLEGSLKAAGCVTHPEVFPGCIAEMEACLGGWSEADYPSSGLDLLTKSEAGMAYLALGLDAQGHPCLPRSIEMRRWLPRQLNKARRVPRLLILRLVDNGSEQLLERADALAKDLMRLGVETLVINFWEPNPKRTPRALAVFSEALRSGTVGEAFQALRDAFESEDSYLSRWAFGLYGNTELKAADLRPLEVGSNLSATTIPKIGRPDFRIRIVEGPEKGRVVPIYSQALRNGQKLTLGSPGLKHCQIEIEDPELADQAISLELEEETIYLSNLCPSPDQVRVEGLAVYQRMPLQGRQTIESGASKLIFEPAAEEQSKPISSRVEKGRFRLTLSTGPEQDRELDFPLVDASTLVGREGAFRLHDPAVSRQHFIILEREGFHQACTLGQAQVILNGVPLQRDTQLRHRDLIQLSDATTLQYVDSSRRSP